MSVIHNEPNVASQHATTIKAYGTVAFNPSVNIGYSESQAVSGLEKSVVLASEVVQLFSSLATKEGQNIQALSDFWVAKDEQMARSQETY